MANGAHSPNMPSQRQLRVGEEIRSVLAQLFAHGETHIVELDSASITVSEVRISPDLKNATAYVMPLGGQNKELIMKVLADNASRIRHLMIKRVTLRTAPKLHFKLDTSYEVAHRVHELLNQVKTSETKDD